MSTRTVYEHLLHPETWIEHPYAKASLYDCTDGQTRFLGEYGFFLLLREQVEDALLFRFSQLMQCACVDPALKNCFAVITTENEVGIFRLNEESQMFEII